MVDVCLVVEGSYPYVTGGVSAWTQRLLEGLPDVSFSVAHLHPADEPPGAASYAPPANASVVHVGLNPERPRPVSPELPAARVYHAACTGSAGELARLAATQQGAGFALTEHGIAWREARWGLAGCHARGCHHGVAGCHHGAARPLTAQQQRERADAVLAMAIESYAAAGAVTSVCGPNAQLQRRLGARPSVIPNAVPAGPERIEHDGFLVGFVGRVVAIKDVETFLRACALVAERRADARFVVVGPTYHEPAYARRCAELAEALGLDVTFTGETDPAPWLARMDALVLTSRSEAQPLVALEAMATGVPVVATDVGGCREALGAAGLLTRPRDPRATAQAVLRIGSDDLLAARLGAAGRRRAATVHDPARVHGAYRELYERLAA